MKELLDELQILQRIDEIVLDAKLDFLLSSEIIEIRGCYFLQALLPEGFEIDVAVKSALDRTDLECDINHIHIGNYIERSEENTRILVEQGVRYVFSLQNLLPRTVEFNVVLACTFDPIVDCNIRFHKQRLGEEWLSNNLENYSDALLVLDSSN